MFEKESFEWTEKNISIGISMYNPSIEMYCGQAFKDAAKFGYDKAKGEIKELLKTLIENCPDTYSGTDAALSQKRMFRFQDAVNKVELFLKEEI